MPKSCMWVCLLSSVSSLLQVGSTAATTVGPTGRVLRPIPIRMSWPFASPAARAGCSWVDRGRRRPESYRGRSDVYKGLEPAVRDRPGRCSWRPGNYLCDGECDLRAGDRPDRGPLSIDRQRYDVVAPRWKPAAYQSLGHHDLPGQSRFVVSFKRRGRDFIGHSGRCQCNDNVFYDQRPERFFAGNSGADPAAR